MTDEDYSLVLLAHGVLGEAHKHPAPFMSRSTKHKASLTRTLLIPLCFGQQADMKSSPGRPGLRRKGLASASQGCLGSASGRGLADQGMEMRKNGIRLHHTRFMFFPVSLYRPRAACTAAIKATFVRDVQRSPASVPYHLPPYPRAPRATMYLPRLE